MESHPQLLVYKASAGSGKTFTLAVHYITQLIEDPYAYRRILAVTFTNKATAEMKERILEQLYGIATADEGSEGYLKEIQKTSAKSAEEIREAAHKALRYIIHDYSRFRIETIDSFFQSVMRNLARELELGANLSIELNNTEVLSDAVDAMIEKLDRKSPVLGWLLEYIDERIVNDRRWDVSKDIKSFGQNIFDESYIEKGEGLRRKMANPSLIPNYRDELRSLLRDTLEFMKGFSLQFEGLLELHGLAPSDLKNGLRGIGSYFNKLASGKFGDDIRNTTVEKCLESEENWASKTSPHRDRIRSLATAELMPLLAEAEKQRPKNNLLLNSCNLSLRYLNNLRLLAHIDKEVRLQNLAHNRFLLSDTNALLHSLIREGDASFVYEKIGTTIDTVMIDEFQDTSRMQWENFRLLLQESLAKKEGSLIVGDIKQSIYRWRSGDWKILAGLGKDRSLRIKECTLGTNWRSEARIIRFNNDFFTAACRTLSLRYRQENGISCEQLEQAYSDVRQHCAKKEEKGSVKITFLQNTRDRPYKEATLQQLAAEVERLAHEGIRLSEMAILVRKNRNIPDIAAYFDEHTPYRIVSDEAFRLSASLAVTMLIDGLRYLSSPGNRTALARLAAAYQQEVLHKETDLNTILLNNPDHYLPAAFRLQADELRFMPLYELLEKLFVLFDMQLIEKQDAYLCAFYDAVTEYMQHNSSELTAFIRFWDEKLNTKTIPSGEIDGIRILSIHKSKGLEYHTVLLPFCDWKMENETNSHLIWCSVAGTGKDTDIPPFNCLDIVPVNYSGAMAESVYHDDYLEEKLQLWVDNLNLLYVAFTRACKNLVVLAGAGLKGTVSELLYDSLPLLKELEFPLTQAHPQDDATGQYGELCTEHDEKKENQSNRLSAAGQGVPVKTESIETHIEFKQSNRSADFIEGDDEEDSRGQYIRRGQLLHQVFAHIEKEDDLPAALERLKFEGIIESEAQKAQIHRLAHQALQHPDVKGWFDGTWELRNECAIVCTDEQGRVQTRRPDRVMRKDGQVVVVDFKFGKQNDTYRAQIREYMELLAQMGYGHIRGFLWYVFSDELEEVTPPSQ